MMYFGFAISDSMFSKCHLIRRESISVEQAKSLLADAIPCVNPSHRATLEAAKVRFGIEIPVPPSPPVIQLAPGDEIIVMGVRGLPRLTDRHEYTSDEISRATFEFARYVVVE